MTVQASIETGSAQPLSVLEQAEAREGRTDWTYADYVAEGRRDYYAQGGKNPLFEKRHADAFAAFHCPLSKRGKQRFGGAF